MTPLVCLLVFLQISVVFSKPIDYFAYLRSDQTIGK